MAFLDLFRRQRAEPTGDATMLLQDLLTTHDPVHVTEEMIAVTPRKQLAETSNLDLRELGTTSSSPWTSSLRAEYNGILRGRLGLRKYDEMRRSDATTRGSLRLMKTPVLGARWFIEPGGDSARDKNAADHVWWNLTEGMSCSWPQLLTEIMLMLDFGYYMLEKVFVDDNPKAPGKVCWQKLSPRHPMDVLGWDYDANGGPDAACMYDSEAQGHEVKIPISKLLVFTFDKEAGNMEGISVLRSAYKHWFYKQNLEKIDAIQKERHGIGIPVIKLPVNYSAKDLLLAEELGRNLRTNERAHVVLPPMWDLLFAKLEGHLVDTLKSVQYHDLQIQKNILAPFMDGSAGTQTKDDDKVLFLKSCRFVADCVEDIFNKWAIPQLCDYNWKSVKYPKLRARRIGEQADWRTLSFAVRNFVGAGIIRPDDRLEEVIRDEMDLPKADPKTVRLVAAPQGAPSTPPSNQKDAENNKGPVGSVKGQPGSAGLPRQTPVANAKLPASNTGKDGSGGK